MVRVVSLVGVPIHLKSVINQIQLATESLAFYTQQTISKFSRCQPSSIAQLGPEVIKLFSCPTQLSMKFFLQINCKLLTISNSFLLNIAEHENFSANKYENANYCWHFHIY